MSTLIHRVVTKARATFARTRINSSSSNQGLELDLAKEDFQRQLKELKELVNGMKHTDLGLERARAFNSNSPRKVNDAPVTYIEVFENSDVSVGIFIIHQGCQIPLHNHPQMFGIIKCLVGSVDVEHFSPLPDLEGTLKPPRDLEYFFKQGWAFPVRKEITRGLNSTHTCSFLTPMERNYHSMTAVEGPAAFIDILAPPYSRDISSDSREVLLAKPDQPEEKRRECDFFEEVRLKDDHLWLRLIDDPENYYCDSEPYQGPNVV